jgi:GxxExxY protein
MINRILAETSARFAGASDSLTEKVIGEAMHVHRVLGPGFLESVYQNALLVRLEKAGLSAKAQYPLSVHFEDTVVGQFFVDILVEDQVILELKAISALASAHEVQLVNYLAATGIEVGLLLNFGTKSLEVKRKSRTLTRSMPAFSNQVNPVNPV